MKKTVSLSNGEWKLMKVLWDRSPQTVSNFVSALKNDTEWTKGTVFIMLSRMLDKGVVRFETVGRTKMFYPLLKKEDANLYETRSFLSKVFDGNIGMMVSSMVGQKALTQKDIDDLYKILQNAEKESNK